MKYNSTGKQRTFENLAGQLTTTEWDCCFAYANNNRGELTNAIAAVDADCRYAYDFDDIGNRKTSAERGANSAYTANQLNQYTAVDDFTPVYDVDGNQTLVKTATGIWSVTYNGENRPILWTCLESNNQINQTNQTISMSYDRMGRRVTKNTQRFVYDGYLQIANFELQTSNIKLQTFIWDPTESVATCPLVWNCESSAAYYVHDGNKNVSEVVYVNGEVTAHYEYTPFGVVIVKRGVAAAANPWRFSSEYAEDDTATFYYNYRHYEPVMGRWASRDMIQEYGGVLLYSCCQNNTVTTVDLLGLKERVKACSNSKDCKTNIQLLSDGLKLSKKRYDEFFNPQFIQEALEDLLLPPERQYKKGRTDLRGREAWDGHVTAFKDSIRHNSNCVKIVLEQLSKGKCDCCDPDQVLDMLVAVEAVLNIYPKKSSWSLIRAAQPCGSGSE